MQQHLPRVRAGLEFCSEADVGGVDVAFVCTPHGQAAPVAKRLLDDGARVIDLSADFRLTAEAYAEWYGEHPHPELLPGVYGLTELHREEVAAAALVANPAATRRRRCWRWRRSSSWAWSTSSSTPSPG